MNFIQIISIVVLILLLYYYYESLLPSEEDNCLYQLKKSSRFDQNPVILTTPLTPPTTRDPKWLPVPPSTADAIDVIKYLESKNFLRPGERKTASCDNSSYWNNITINPEYKSVGLFLVPGRGYDIYVKYNDVDADWTWSLYPSSPIYPPLC